MSLMQNPWNHSLSYSKSSSSVYSTSTSQETHEYTSSVPLQSIPYGLSKCNSEIISRRGFKPTDLKDASKRDFLTDLGRRIWSKNQDPYIPNTKPINLEKIFTPATDADAIKPNMNKTMYASSSFYSKELHPTIEEQVKLAHKISSSLSDASNTRSKGQSMYLNRKKRSVQWVHEQNGQQTSGSTVESESNVSDKPPPPLKLLMNPYGKVMDVDTLRRQTGSEPLSPDFTFNVVSALNASKGKGAELFAKRRKKSERWVVDEVKSTEKTINRENSISQNYIATPMTPLTKVFGEVDEVKTKPFFQSQQSQYWNQPKEHLYRPKPPQSWIKTGPQNKTNGAGYNQPPQYHYPSAQVGPGQNNFARVNRQTSYTPVAPQLKPVPTPTVSIPPPIAPKPAPEILAKLPPGPSFSRYQSRNYNTAPRGWGQIKDYYRPVTFDNKHAPCTGY